LDLLPDPDIVVNVPLHKLFNVLRGILRGDAIQFSLEFRIEAHFHDLSVRNQGRSVKSRYSKAVPESFDVIIIGGGHNGLVTGAYLVRAGPAGDRIQKTGRGLICVALLSTILKCV
jgi:hypothetical protein